MHEPNEFLATTNERLRVRANFTSAAIGAALMLYFGYFRGIAEPSGFDLFSQAAWVFYHTLRMGGIAMVIIALLSLIGNRFVLLLDAFLTVPIGLLFMGTGLVMRYDGGDNVQMLINVVCGGLFIRAAVLNTLDFVTFSRNRPPFEPRTSARSIAISPMTDKAGSGPETRLPLSAGSLKPLDFTGPSAPTAPPAEIPTGHLAGFADPGPPPRV